MQDKIKVSDDIVIKTQRANVEMEAKRGVLAFMISSGTPLEDENFKRYEESYMKAFEEFENTKQDVERNIVKAKHPNAINWVLDYNNKEITVTY